MPTAKFLSAYSAKSRHQTNFSSKSRTKQSFKDECDVNNIMKRFVKTGVIDFTNKHAGRYADVTGLTFQAAQNVIAAAQTMFHELPAVVRDRFRNDPASFLDFVNNPENREEARALGLLKPEEPQPGAADAARGGATPPPQAEPQPQKEGSVKA